MIYAFYAMFHWFVYGLAPSLPNLSETNLLSVFRSAMPGFLENLIQALRGLFAGGEWSLATLSAGAEGYTLDYLCYGLALALSLAVAFFVLRLVVYLFSLFFGRRAR